MLRIITISAALALATAAGARGQPATKADMRAEIAKQLEIKPEDVRPSPVNGLYEVASGTEVGYVSTDGRYYINGDLYDMRSRSNLTEKRRQQGRLAMVESVGEGSSIVFAPRGPARHTITVFTDIDCAYCRRLHSEMEEINRLGIRVRYLMYPRGGQGTEAWRKAEAVWCSPDRRNAMTRAKRGEDVKAGKCPTPVERHYELGREIGIRGTPGIITDQGDYIAGYMPAARLAEQLEAAKKAD